MKRFRFKHTTITTSIPSGIAGVYMITNKNNGKIYIGSGKDIRDRWGGHEYSIKRKERAHLPFVNALRKYGSQGFTWEILEECDTDGLEKSKIRDLLIEREQYYLDKYKPFVWLDKGYNHNPIAYSCSGRKQTGKAAAGVPRPNRLGKPLIMGGLNKKGSVRNSKAKWFKATNPQGKCFTRINLIRFCHKHNLNKGRMAAIARGDIGCYTHKGGWTICYIEKREIR